MLLLSDESSRDLVGSKGIELIYKVFPDGEQYVRLPTSVAGEHVIYVTRAYPNQDRSLVRSLLVINALKDLGASRVGLFMPYMPYARQDRRFLDGEAISIDYIIKSLKNAGLDELFVVDIHKPEVLERNGLGINLEPFQAYSSLLSNLKNPLVLSPDVGSLWRAKKLAQLISADFDYLEKTRDRFTGQVSIKPKDISAAGRDVVIIDDIIATGGTIVNGINALKGEALTIRVIAAHCLLLNDADQKIINAGAAEIICSNSILTNYSKADVSQLLFTAIK
ncbi:MAG: ribose-phosphate diphosphokinase [Thermocladium sp.]